MPRSLDPSVGEAEPIGGTGLPTTGSVLKRRFLSWALPTVLACLAIGIFVTKVTPRYTAETRILLANQEAFTRSDRIGLPNDGSNQLDEVAVTSQVQLITSLDTARRAIKALHLAGNDEFDPLAQGMNPLTRVLVLIGLLPDPTRQTAEARMVQTFEQKLTVNASPKTRVMTIKFTSHDPVLAARGANEVAALYLQEQTAAKRGTAQDSAEALSKQITDLRAKLADADTARESYRRSTGLLAGTNDTTSGQSLADLDNDLSRARASQADAHAKAAMIRDLLNQGRAADVADVTTSPIVRQLWTQRSTAQAQLATETRTLLPEHPRVKELTAQLKEIDVALKSAAKQAATSLENDAKVAGQRVASLEAALAKRKQLVGTADADGVQLTALDRASQSLEEQLQGLTTKYDEALARQSSTATSADARLISTAAPPQEPSYPKKLQFLLVGTLVTLALSIGWVVASERLSGRVNRRMTRTARPASPRVADEPAAAEPIAARFKAAETTRPIITPSRWSASFTASAARASDDTDFWADAPARPPTSVASAPEEVSVSRAASSPRFELLRKLGVARDGSDVVLDPVSPHKTVGPQTGGRGPRRWVKGSVAALAAFGRPASDPNAKSVTPSSSSEAPRVDFGWDPVVTTPNPVAAAEASGEEVAVAPDLDVAERIVARHVPGRGLHVVGAGIGVKAAAFDKLIALARALAEKGRSIIVDLNASPAKLASLGARENGQAVVAGLDGLSELLAGEASFAEVIHRDHQTRLHFIPTGRKEADFRDFDLILDALTETYDFIVLLTPAFPQSEIAKVMAPYADLVVLSSADAADFAVLEALEGELSAAGAREVLVAGAVTPSDRSARVFA